MILLGNSPLTVTIKLLMFSLIGTKHRHIGSEIISPHVAITDRELVRSRVSQATRDDIGGNHLYGSLHKHACVIELNDVYVHILQC